MQMLFYAHSGLRYLVLLAGILALLYLAFAEARGKTDDRVGRILGSAFVGLIDLQALLGVGMVAMGLYYPALMGHIVMMILAAVSAHVAMAMSRSAEPIDRRNKFRLGGVVVALALIFMGIRAIGRPIFESGVPSITG